MRLSLFLAAALLFGMGCASAPPTSTALSDATWHLTRVYDAPVGSEASLTFAADGTVTGSTGCNTFSGAYTLTEGGRLAFAPLATTRRACLSAAGEQETRVLEALNAVASADRDGDRLTLRNASGDALLTYVDASAMATLSGSVTYRQRVALPPDAIVTVRLLDISRADAPADVLAQQTVHAAGRQVPFDFELTYASSDIQANHRYSLRAEIRTPEGGLMWTTDTVAPVLTQGAPTDDVSLMLILVDPTLSAALAGPTWTLARIEAASSETTTFGGGETYTLVFATDGRYGGQADCNRISGTYDQNAESLTLHPGVTTRRACAPTSSFNAVLGHLANVTSHRISGGELHLRTASGDTLVFT